MSVEQRAEQYEAEAIAALVAMPGWKKVPAEHAVREGDRCWNIHSRRFNKIRVPKSRTARAGEWHFVIREEVPA